MRTARFLATLLACAPVAGVVITVAGLVAAAFVGTDSRLSMEGRFVGLIEVLVPVTLAQCGVLIAFLAGVFLHWQLAVRTGEYRRRVWLLLVAMTGLEVVVGFGWPGLLVFVILFRLPEFQRMRRASELVTVPVPSLAFLLLRAEELKGAALTEEEVLRIRDRAACRRLLPDEAERLPEARDYRTVPLEQPWTGYQVLRRKLARVSAGRTAGRANVGRA